MAARTKVPKKKKILKNCLASPCINEWPKLEKGDNKNILDEIRRAFPPLRIQRKNEADNVNVSGDDNAVLTWRSMKKCLVVGINEVTKALEKDNLVLVLVCKSTKPAILTNHLILLSATRLTAACGLFGLSEVMAPLLGIKTVAACGFKKDMKMEVMKDLVEYIVCKTPPLPPCLQIWSECLQENGKTPSHITDQNCANLVGKTDGQRDGMSASSVRKSNKRTLESCYVQAHVKRLQPSGKTKVKKIKRKKSKT